MPITEACAKMITHNHQSLKNVIQSLQSLEKVGQFEYPLRLLDC